MPAQTTRHIVITSANCATAAMLIPRLREKGYHTTGLIRRPASIGTDETIADWMETAAAKGALARADTIIHLSGDANAGNRKGYVDANYETAKRVATSVRTSKEQRIIFLSYTNAGTWQKNAYLHYKGQAENILTSTGKELVIFRCPVMIDAPGTPSRMDDLFISKNGKPVPVIGSGGQKMRPVYRGDVVDAILAACESGRPGLYELSGPEEMTIDALIRLANGNPSVKMRHIPGWAAQLLSRVMPGLSPTFVDLMLHHTESSYDPDTYSRFGITPTSLTSLFART